MIFTYKNIINENVDDAFVLLQNAACVRNGILTCVSVQPQFSGTQLFFPPQANFFVWQPWYNFPKEAISSSTEYFLRNILSWQFFSVILNVFQNES